MTYLQLSGIADDPSLLAHDAAKSDDETVNLKPVTHEELMNVSRCTMTVIRSLIDKQILTTYRKEVGRLNNGGSAHPEHIKPLNDAQTDAYNQILLQMMNHKVTLLQGVTSSGKTEIYIHLIQKRFGRAQTSALLAARNCADGSDYGTPEARFWRPTGYLPQPLQ